MKEDSRCDDANELFLTTRAEGEAVRLGACIHIAKSSAQNGAMQMYALQETVIYLLEKWRTHYTALINVTDERGGITTDVDEVMSMLSVLLAALLEVFCVLGHILDLHKSNLKKLKNGYEPVSVGNITIIFNEDSLDSTCCVVSKKLQSDCVSLLITIVDANPFGRCFPQYCSSPTSAIEFVCSEKNEIDHMNKKLDKDKERLLVLLSLKDMEITFLKHLQAIITEISTRLFNEEDSRGVALNTIAKLEPLLLSTALGSACPRTLLVSRQEDISHFS